MFDIIIWKVINYH